MGAEQHPPLLFTNPFCYEPHPWVKQAAEEVTRYLDSKEEWKEEISRGKMFGVLVVKKHGKGNERSEESVDILLEKNF